MSAPRTYCSACGQPQFHWPGRAQRACMRGHGLNPSPETRIVPAVRKVAAALLLGLLAVDGHAQPPKPTLKRGVGYATPPGARATWKQKNQPGQPEHVRVMDVGQEPWPSGIPAAQAGSHIEDLPAFFRRYGITGEEFFAKQFLPYGFSNEHYAVTYECLEILCKASAAGLGPPSVFDCVPRATEAYDAAVRNREGQGLYATCFALTRSGDRPPTCPPCPESRPCPPAPECAPCAACPEAPPCPAPSPCPACPSPTAPAGIWETVELLRAATAGLRREPIPVTHDLRRRVRELHVWFVLHVESGQAPAVGSWLDQPVSLEVKGAPVRDVLGGLCLARGCTWQVRGGEVVLVPVAEGAP